MRSELPFGSFLVYPTGRQTQRSHQVRQVTLRVKTDGPGPAEHSSLIRYLAGRIREEVVRPGSPLAEIFGAQGTYAVPAPRSSPLFSDKTLWPALRICDELVLQGLVEGVSPLVLRTKRVQKSARAQPGERPTLREHQESMKAHRALLYQPESVLLVDDVITTGATLMAMARLIDNAFPNLKTLRAFAVSRTLSGLEAVEPADPCAGSITVSQWGNCRRDP